MNQTVITAMSLQRLKKRILPSQIHFIVLADYLTFMQNLEIVKICDQILFFDAEI